SEEHTSELQSLTNLVCRLLLEKKNPRPVLTASLSLILLSSRVDELGMPAAFAVEVAFIALCKSLSDARKKVVGVAGTLTWRSTSVTLDFLRARAEGCSVPGRMLKPNSVVGRK